MATKTWIGAAADVAQVTTLEIVNTWASGDTATITIGNRDLTVTSGSGTLQAIADEIVLALQGSSRREATSGYSWTAGGREYGEFLELVSVDDEGGGSTTITLQGPPGVPLDISESVVTAGTGDITLTTVQAATGKHFFDNADNWDTGSVPVDNDDIVFESSDVDCKYGFPASLDPDTVTIKASFTGWLGLPITNRTTAKPYREYRSRFLALDNDTATGAGSIEIGEGKGPGSQLINIDWASKGTLLVLEVLKSGPQSTQFPDYPVNIKGSGSSIAAFLLDGIVAIAPEVADAANLIGLQTAGGREDGPTFIVGPSVGGTITLLEQNGGRIENNANGLTITTLRNLRGTFAAMDGSPSVTTINAYGRIELISGLSATNLNIGGTGVVDATKANSSSTYTNTNMTAGATLLDPNQSLTFSNGVDLYQCGLEEVTLDWAEHRTLSISAI